MNIPKVNPTIHSVIRKNLCPKKQINIPNNKRPAHKNFQCSDTATKKTN